jgi:glycosyltransferase involved in cell wall biosynthesis
VKHTSELISIILPVYNQGDHIADAVDEYEQALIRLENPHELLLVPNGCRDNSLEVCRALASTHSTVRVLELSRSGWGHAVRVGLAEAKGGLLSYANSARTRAEELILLLLYAVAFPDVVVKANRKIRESAVRRLGSLLYNLECRMLFDLSQWDINGTPKVFPRKFSRLLELERDDDLIDLEFNVVCRRQAYPMIEVPIFSRTRHGGRSTTGLRSALRMYSGALAMSREQSGSHAS